MNRIWISRVCGAIALVGFFATMSNAEGINSLEEERTKQLKEMGVLLPNPDEIVAAANAEFSKDIDDQDADSLEEIAAQANHYANLVAKIGDEYSNYIMDNSRYDFVTEEVRKATLVDALTNKDSVFKNIRNKAYLNLGRLTLADGKEMEAYLFFNDAFRLSSFTCSDGKENCVRYEAEQYMKSLLDLEGESYVHWQK